jgi:hypothetical protein
MDSVPTMRRTRPEPSGTRDESHAPKRSGWLREFLADRVFNSATLFGVIPVGTAFGHWISKIIALPRLRRLTSYSIACHRLLRRARAAPIRYLPVITAGTSCSTPVISKKASFGISYVGGGKRCRISPGDAPMKYNASFTAWL